jgi:hypothetical protein
MIIHNKDEDVDVDIGIGIGIDISCRSGNHTRVVFVNYPTLLASRSWLLEGGASCLNDALYIHNIGRAR